MRPHLIGAVPFALVDGDFGQSTICRDLGAETTGLDAEAVTAARADGFSTLLAAIDAAGLTGTLRGEGPFTDFAPTDDGCAAMDQDALADPLKPENTDALAAVLSFHALPGRIMYDDITTIAGLPLKVTVDGDTKTIGNAVIIGSDIEATNGVIHVPDRVITPE